MEARQPDEAPPMSSQPDKESVPMADEFDGIVDTLEAHERAYDGNINRACGLGARRIVQLERELAEAVRERNGFEQEVDRLSQFRTPVSAIGTPVVWRYRYGKTGMWRYVEVASDCNIGEQYEREPLYAASLPERAPTDPSGGDHEYPWQRAEGLPPADPEADALKKDAARYRYLREKQWIHTGFGVRTGSREAIDKQIDLMLYGPEGGK